MYVRHGHVQLASDTQVIHEKLDCPVFSFKENYADMGAGTSSRQRGHMKNISLCKQDKSQLSLLIFYFSCLCVMSISNSDTSIWWSNLQVPRALTKMVIIQSLRTWRGNKWSSIHAFNYSFFFITGHFIDYLNRLPVLLFLEILISRVPVPV
jgi:hypothetical protein